MSQVGCTAPLRSDKAGLKRIRARVDLIALPQSREMAARGDFSQTWLSLWELFESVRRLSVMHRCPHAESIWAAQAAGLKLRINVVDTVIFREGRIAAWFYTSRDGAVCRASPHECSPSAFYQKLVGMAMVDENRNPYGYVGLAHYDSGVSRPVKQHELQQIVSSSTVHLHAHLK